MLIAALIMMLQVTPLPASPSGQALSPDCMRREDVGQLCPFGSRGASAESACVRAAQHQERCAQQTTGFVHYVLLLRAGSLWGVAGAWLGHRTPGGHIYLDNSRRIYVQLANDPNAPGTISDAARTTLRRLYGTEHPTSSTPLIVDRKRT
ncbi:MAG TPA: hypothetical protein VGU66_08140 [Candidatus Elarobacter sp.]|nr:hypothetical protein [Candidatus Elarobacter sp.]